MKRQDQELDDAIQLVIDLRGQDPGRRTESLDAAIVALRRLQAKARSINVNPFRIVRSTHQKEI